MSIPVTIAKLQEAIDRYGSVAYFLTVGPDGRPHNVQLPVTWEDPDHLVVHPGNSTVANAEARPLVALLWPPFEKGGYSLIVDAAVVGVSGSGAGDNTVTVAATKAVLHRPARSEDPEAVAHGSDCVGVFSTNS